MKGAADRGRQGEGYAASYLESQGYRILARNYRSRWGEIDLIAEKEAYLAFVEVKLRKNSSFSAPREAVTPAKQQKLRQTALCYLAENGMELQPRFDVAEVYLPPYGEAQIDYFENAFV